MSEYLQGKKEAGSGRAQERRPASPRPQPGILLVRFPQAPSGTGGQSGRAQRETPCRRGHRAGLSPPLIHGFTFNLADPL